MAQLQSLSITGSLNLASTTENTGSAGNMWFDPVANKIKVSVFLPPVWSAGGNMLTAMQQLGSAGTQTAALAIGGYSSFFAVNCTEEYNGTSWASGGGANQYKTRNSSHRNTKCCFSLRGNLWLPQIMYLRIQRIFLVRGWSYN